MPDDLSSVTNEKHLPASTSTSSVDHTHLPDKATDGAPLDSKSLRSEDIVSSANKLGSLDKPAGTRPSPEVTSRDGQSTSPGKTSLVPTNANDISSTNRDNAHGSNTVSLGDNSQAVGEPDDTSDTSKSRPLKRKLATSTDAKLPETQGMLQGSKKKKPSTNSSSLTANESTTITSGPAVSISRPTTSIASTQGTVPGPPAASAHTQTSTNAAATTQDNASAVPTASAHTQTPTNATATTTQGNAPVATSTSAHTQAPTIAAALQGNASVATTTFAQTQIPTAAHSVAVPPVSTVQLSPIDQVITHLRQRGVRPLGWIQVSPIASGRNLGMDRRIKAVDFKILDLSVGKIIKLDKGKVCRRLASNDVLPTLSQFKTECLDNLQVRATLMNVLILSDSPWKALTELIASCAKNYDEILSRAIQFQHPHRGVILRCARYVRRLVRDSRASITSYSDECAFPDMDRFLRELCARALLTAYDDYLRNARGFFGTLFGSSFALPMTWQARKSCERILGFEHSITDAEWRTPSVVMQRAVNAFSHAMKPRTAQKTNNKDDKLIVKDKELEMANSFTQELKDFETEASLYPGLLLAMNTGPVVDGPHRSNTLPTRIVDHMSVCTRCNPVVRPAPPVRQFFAKDKDTDRIMPSIKVSAASNNADPFNDEERLAFFLKFKAVHAGPAVTSLDGVPMTNAAISLMKWSAIAEVQPGRGIADCIELYNQNIQILSYAQG